MLELVLAKLEPSCFLSLEKNIDYILLELQSSLLSLILQLPILQPAADLFPVLVFGVYASLVEHLADLYFFHQFVGFSLELGRVLEVHVAAAFEVVSL